MINGCRSGVGTTRVQSPAQLVATDGRRNRITIVDSGFHFAAFLVVVPSRHAEVFELMARVVVVRDQIHGVEQRLPALLGGDAIRTPTGVVVGESFFDSAVGILIRVGNGIMLKFMVLISFGIAYGA